MTVFHCDLDNTLMYSHRRELPLDKIPVELYEGKEITFVSAKTAQLLKQLPESLYLVPTTTRSLPQYQRITLGIDFPYALVANGAILLKQGVVEEQWYQETSTLVSCYRPSLQQAQEALEQDSHRATEVRWVEDFFLYCKSNAPERTAEMLVSTLKDSSLVVQVNGQKVYVLPDCLEKGNAVQRFRSYLPREKEIVAGDSTMDISMLQAVSTAYCPQELQLSHGICPPEGELFSDFLLRDILRQF